MIVIALIQPNITAIDDFKLSFQIHFKNNKEKMEFRTSLKILKFLVFILSKTVVESNQNCYWVPVKYFPHCSYYNHHINKGRDFENYADIDYITYDITLAIILHITYMI